MGRKKIKLIHQLQSTDCAAACLTMICNYYGKLWSLEQVKKKFDFTRVGVSIQDIIQISLKLGLESSPFKLTTEELSEIPLPLILYWKQDHFIILERIKISNNNRTYYLADPAYGRIKLDEESFLNEWSGNNDKGIAIYSEPLEFFEKIILEKKESKFLNSPFFSEAVKYIRNKKKTYISVLLLIIFGLCANWLIPFFFQKIIDNGIVKNNINIVYILSVAQFFLFLSSYISDFVSQLVLTKTNFNLSIILKNNILKKLIRLPVNYFDTTLNTETLQRLNDQNTIQNYITWKGINAIINLLNILIFGGILFYFNKVIFSIYIFLSILSVLWILFFLKQRKIIEYSLFIKKSQHNNNIYEFIMNMPEIKINNAQNYIINKILRIQEQLYKVEIKSLYLNMYQLMGVGFISKFKEILTVGICAILIIEKSMSLGTLLSISYIIGQLTGPIQNLVSFIKETQDTDIANKRIGEIYNVSDEDNNKPDLNNNFNNIYLHNVCFKYPGSFNPFIIKDITLDIPKNTVTAIVGASGSGKTTLLKLLLSYYEITNGNIYIGDENLKNINSNKWRSLCGIVLQDGHIFSGTILENIVFSDNEINISQLNFAIQAARIDEFINLLPMGLNTKVGNIGIQLSGGQKQRLLIARAIYKNPQFLFLDEATSALDAENEKEIHNNLQLFFKGKTVIIIAHRLSTVKNADQIIVLKHGLIIEKGTHQELVSKKTEYFNLVKNQLELGN